MKFKSLKKEKKKNSNAQKPHMPTILNSALLESYHIYPHHSSFSSKRRPVRTVSTWRLRAKEGWTEMKDPDYTEDERKVVLKAKGEKLLFSLRQFSHSPSTSIAASPSAFAGHSI